MTTCKSSFLTLSPNHLSDTTFQLLLKTTDRTTSLDKHLEVYSHPTKIFVYIPKRAEKPNVLHSLKENIPTDLFHTILFATTKECKLICFDTKQQTKEPILDKFMKHETNTDFLCHLSEKERLIYQNLIIFEIYDTE